MSSKTRKKLDNRIRILIENGINVGHRSLFVIVGEKARDQVVLLHHILSKSQIKSRPSVLWCYKDELGFSTNRHKRMREIKKKMKTGDINEDNPFELFISSTTIRWCYYKETHNILGNTYSMLVLQDFEALTPNLLARSVETIEGGGLVVILLNTVKSLRQLTTMAMDVHSRYRTESHQDVTPRFNERFILSLASCKACLVLDDQLDILPISSHASEIEAVPKPDLSVLTAEQQQLMDLKEQLADTQPVSSLINCCKTLDQAKSVLKFVDIITEKTLKATVSLTAARGRGKSAALGLAIAGAIAFNYTNIFVTSPSPENLKTLFEFVLKGFEAIHLKEHLDYEVIRSTVAEYNKSVVRIEVVRDHRQTIQYIHPVEAMKSKLFQKSAELVVIDEAAAIPLPVVKALFGPYLVFMSSTVNGYEGTGRSLSLKLLDQLRQQSSLSETADQNSSKRSLSELTLDESIRYKNGDLVEYWLNSLLCLDANIVKLHPSHGCPPPEQCELFYINRDTLFSYHQASEVFLHQLMSLYVASHYKNTPNDLQIMSDAPAHHLFCLLSPVSQANKSKGRLPQVLCFIQICHEGKISSESIMNSLGRGNRPSGDLIPWTISQQYQDRDFGALSGARVVRIATNPNYQQMGYGTRALKLLEDYYNGKFDVNLNPEKSLKDSDASDTDDDNAIVPKKALPPLLSKLDERKAERLDYIGVSFGMTSQLLKFWKKNGYVPLYIRQTANDLTGEHSCVMLKLLTDVEELDGSAKSRDEKSWLADFWVDFRKRFLNLLSYNFKVFNASFALNIIERNKLASEKSKPLSRDELEIHMTPYDVNRLELYAKNLADYHLIVDMIPILAQFYFTGKFGPDFSVSAAQSSILLSIGLQRKSVDDISEELKIPASQVLALFNRAITKMSKYLRSLLEKDTEDKLGFNDATKQIEGFNPVEENLDDELDEAAAEILVQEKKQLTQDMNELAQYAIKSKNVAIPEESRSAINIKKIKPKRKDFKKPHFNKKMKKH